MKEKQFSITLALKFLIPTQITQYFQDCFSGRKEWLHRFASYCPDIHRDDQLAFKRSKIDTIYTLRDIYYVLQEQKNRIIKLLHHTGLNTGNRIYQITKFDLKNSEWQRPVEA